MMLDAVRRAIVIARHTITVIALAQIGVPITSSTTPRSCGK